MKYADLSKEHRALKKLNNSVEDSGSSWRSHDAYWTALEAFKVRLKHALQDDELLRKLTRPQLIQVIAWSSSYRPIPPHVVLSTIGKLAGPPG